MICTSGLNYDVEFEADAMLIPGQTYYVWIYPGFASGGEPNGNYTVGQFEWYGLSSHVYTIELSGAAGVVEINTSAGVVRLIFYVYIENEWKQILLHIRISTGWELQS